MPLSPLLHVCSFADWDDGINGKWYPFPVERALHHYGSGINSAVLLRAYRMWPNDTIALRAGYAASLGPLATINVSTGAPSMNFHADPSILTNDPYSADWGVGFAVATEGWGCYVHAEAGLGLTGYGCDVTNTSASVVTATLRDAYRRVVYIGPLGLEVRSRNGPISTVTWDSAASTVTFAIDVPHLSPPASTVPYSALRLEVSTPAASPAMRVSSWAWAQPSTPPPMSRGAYQLPANTTSVAIKYVR